MSRKTRRKILRVKLLDMSMVADMIFTIAVITIAATAVTEFQFGVAHIRASADSTLVRVRGFCLGGGRLMRTCGSERNGAGFLRRFFLEEFACFDTPGHRDHI